MYNDILINNVWPLTTENSTLVVFPHSCKICPAMKWMVWLSALLSKNSLSRWDDESNSGPLFITNWVKSWFILCKWPVFGHLWSHINEQRESIILRYCRLPYQYSYFSNYTFIIILGLKVGLFLLIQNYHKLTSLPLTRLLEEDCAHLRRCPHFHSRSKWHWDQLQDETLHRKIHLRS